MNIQRTVVSVVAIVVAFASQARAQTAGNGEKKSWFEQPLEAPTKALEVVVGTGYTQGFGELQKGLDMRNVATPGIGVDLGFLYRIDPRWAVGLVGQYQEFQAERADAARGFTAGIAAAYHMAPYTRTDPWISLGTGYRALWETHPEGTPNLMTHGLELAKLVVGVDFRLSPDIAIAPVVGADVTLPLWQSVGNAPSTAIADVRPAAYVFAGLQAKFDVTQTHVSNQPQEPPPVITEAPLPAPQIRPVSPSLGVSEDLLAKCNINLNSVEKAPKFEFDKSDLQPEDLEVLHQIADCFTFGPLKGSGLVLVGRADPRGTIPYNDRLGMRRASTVATFLEQRGVEPNRIDRISRGERDATGIDEATWRDDRRVDITWRP